MLLGPLTVKRVSHHGAARGKVGIGASARSLGCGRAFADPCRREGALIDKRIITSASAAINSSRSGKVPSGRPIDYTVHACTNPHLSPISRSPLPDPLAFQVLFGVGGGRNKEPQK